MKETFFSKNMVFTVILLLIFATLFFQYTVKRESSHAYNVDCSGITSKDSISASIKYYLKHHNNKSVVKSNKKELKDEKYYKYKDVEDFRNRNENCCTFDYNVNAYVDTNDLNRKSYCAIVTLDAKDFYQKGQIVTESRNSSGFFFAVDQDYKIFNLALN